MLKKRIVFGLGSNEGDRKKFLDLAVENLTSALHLTHLKKSKILENKALLLPDSPKNWDKDFFNLAISANIDIDNFPPLKILKIIKNIETKLGRVSRGKWSPREIDIDILAIEDLAVNLDLKLQIPHQELFNRDFFIKPFFEIEPKLLETIKHNAGRT
jgi:2-amino-4-hydroxy-6-hydroxymethyldihydropteridine diphosphokinase